MAKRPSTKDSGIFPSYKVLSVDALIPYARNARTHSEEQVAQIAASIREFGFLNPVIVDGEAGIVAGHGRVLAARKLGMTELPTIEASHLSDAQRRAYILADNKLALNAGWDNELLRVEVEDLSVAGFDLALTGFSQADLAGVTLNVDHGPTDAGQLWQGMPEFVDDDPCFRKIVVNFDSQGDVNEFMSLIGQEHTEKTKSIWFPQRERRDLKSQEWQPDA